MQKTCRKKHYIAYMAILPKGYYFDGTKAVPKEEEKSNTISKYIGIETPVICMPDGSIKMVNSYSGYYYNDSEIDRDTIIFNSLQVEKGRVTNKKYKEGNFAMPWKMIVYKATDKTYEVAYKNGKYYVKEEDGIKEYSPELFKTIFNNKGFEKELENVGLLSFTPEPIFEVKKAGDADFADDVIYRLNELYDKSFDKLSLMEVPVIQKKDKNTVLVSVEEMKYEIIKDNKNYVLKESGEIFVETDDEKEFMTYVIAILGYFSNSTLNSFMQKPLTNEEYNCIYNYTTSEYETINDFLRKKDNEFITFLHYIKAVRIHEILQKSYPYKNLCLFRGVSVENEIYKEIKENYVLKDDGFKSTSFKADIGTGFMDTTDDHHGVYCIINCKPHTKCLYIQNMAEVKEYETLLDMNYDLKFIKQLGTYEGVPVWLTETVKVEKKLTNYLYQPDGLETVLNILQSDNVLRQLFYISYIEDSSITLAQMFNEDNEVIISVSEKSVSVATEGKKPVFLILDNENIDKLLLKAVYDCQKEAKPDENAIWKVNQRISQNLVSVLLANNIVIKAQDVHRMTTDLQIYVDSYNSTNDLETLLVQIKYRVDEKDIYISFDCNLGGNLRKSKEIKITPKNIDKIGNSIFEYLMATYTLNCERRLLHIVKLVGGYYMKDSSIERYNTGYKAQIGDKVLYITKVGNNLKANGLEFNYADNIYDIASAIKDELNM